MIVNSLDQFLVALIWSCIYRSIVMLISATCHGGAVTKRPLVGELSTDQVDLKGINTHHNGHIGKKYVKPK